MTNREAVQQFKAAKPPADKIADRKARFAALNAFVTKRNGWLTSIPGALDVTMETLPDSGLPDELRELGYDLREDGTSERILAFGITEHIPVTEGSTATRRVQHAGIVKVRRYAFEMP